MIFPVKLKYFHCDCSTKSGVEIIEGQLSKVLSNREGLNEVK